MAEDTVAIMDLLSTSDIQRIMPRNTVVLWGSRSLNFEGGVEQFALYGVRDNAELTGEVIEEASIQFDPTTNVPEVSMGMNSEGARVWSRITGANIGKPIAIVLDGYVVSYPNVSTKITGGNSSITGLENVAEAEDLVNILLSGALPAPLRIMEERTVGADLALLLNIIFILGILAGFKATLTLPGMAGIVLTIGMAVDANVLIFDRIREEQRGGKTMKAAISAGYANAMSAIIDANVTTGFVALILMSFGVGPIKGFAVTLLAGIACSLFSAIVITRVVIDYLTRNNTEAVSFG
jgi:preprotein translocase subunit SecD